MADSDIHKKLYYASIQGDDSLVRELLAAGADPDEFKDNSGNTALHEAASQGNNTTVSILIDHGADLNIQNQARETALQRAAKKEKNEVATKLIEAGSDMNIQDKNGETALHRAAASRNDEVTTRLIKAGADLNIENNYGKTALERAVSRRHYDIVTKLIEAEAKTPPSLARLLMQGWTSKTPPNPETVSSVLDFLSQNLRKFRKKNQLPNYQKTKESLGIETVKGKKKIMFYNENYKNLDNQTLLEYINSQNERLARQREELIDLSVKIANFNHTRVNKGEKPSVDIERAMEEVINHYKSGLPSGVGLRDMITMIRERYPWSSSKTMIMIFISLITFLLGVGLYVLDLTTDVKFSLDMLKKTNESSNDSNDFDSTLKSLHPNCYAVLNSTFYENCDGTTDFDDFLLKTNSAPEKNYNRKSNKDDYVVTAWISIWHCIQPFVVTAFVSLTIQYKRGCSGLKCSIQDIPDLPDCLKNNRACQMVNTLLCCIPFKLLWPLGCLGYLLLRELGRVVPIPALTNFYRFYLDVRCHDARSKPDFRTRIVSIEKEIREHEALGELWKIQNILLL